ncbi:MAG: ferredoxin [Lachnospiraceae bacterium]
MEAIVQDGCISCGVCVSTCPEVFHFNSDGIAEGGQVDNSNEDAAKEARDGCPVSVIDVEA